VCETENGPKEWLETKEEFLRHRQINNNKKGKEQDAAAATPFVPVVSFQKNVCV